DDTWQRVDPHERRVLSPLRRLRNRIPAEAMAQEPDGRTAWVFSTKPGESDFLTVDLWKGERKDSKRLHDNPGAADFLSDGRRAYVALVFSDSWAVQRSWQHFASGCSKGSVAWRV